MLIILNKNPTIVYRIYRDLYVLVIDKIIDFIIYDNFNKINIVTILVIIA